MGNATITEEAPDIIALALILDIFGEEQEKQNLLLDGAPLGYSKEQFLFYTLAATWCTRKLDHAVDSKGKPKEHSPRKGRLNAMLMHSEYFHENFKYKEGDKMWRKPDHFCHLLEPDAVRR